MDYLAKRAEELNVKTEINPNLEEWFYNDPVERTVNLEAGIIAKKRELDQAKRGPDEARPVSPGTRFEEMEEQEKEILLPHGTNSVMIHNEQSMFVVYL